MKSRESRSRLNRFVVMSLAVGMAAVCHVGIGADRLVLGEYLNATW